MVGDGVIAESIISFKITWYNPGNGEQPKWDQTKQKIYFHKSDLYPDLLYTKAQGIATYYKYTTIDRLLVLIKQINAIIDSKLSVNEETELLGPGSSIQKVGSTAIQAQPSTAIQTTASNLPATTPKGGVPATVKRGQLPATIDNTSKALVKSDDITNDTPTIDEPDVPDSPAAYTVIVHGSELNFIDVQLSSVSIRIRHKVSKNLFRKINDEVIDNTTKIWVEVQQKGRKSQRFEMKDFETTDEGINLLVEILPTIDLVLTPEQTAAPIKSEEEINDEDRIKKFAKLRRYDREEKRYMKSKSETEQAADTARKIKTKRK